MWASRAIEPAPSRSTASTASRPSRICCSPAIRGPRGWPNDSQGAVCARARTATLRTSRASTGVAPAWRSPHTEYMKPQNERGPGFLALMGLAVLALLLSVAWLVLSPGLESGLAAVLGLSALISLVASGQRSTRRTQIQRVERGSVGLQAGGDIRVAQIGVGVDGQGSRTERH
jgi:hypothetical protein